MIDDLDKKMIQQLQENGRESFTDLGSMLGVVEGTVRKRFRRLVNEGIIKAVAIPDMHKLGYGLMAIMGLQVRMENLRAVADALVRNEHVCYLAFVAGRYDLMAIIMVKSPQHLSYLIEKEISVIPSVLRTETFINLDIIKGTGGLLDTTQLVRNLDISSPSRI